MTKPFAAEKAATQWIRQKLRDHKMGFWLLAKAIVSGATITDPLPKGTTVIIRNRLTQVLKNSSDNLEEQLPTIQKISQKERKSQC